MQIFQRDKPKHDSTGCFFLVSPTVWYGAGLSVEGLDVRSELAEKATFNMPIAQLATLGAGVSSLIPALHTVTQTMPVNIQGLFRLANAGVEDAFMESYDIFARKKLYDKDLVEQTYKYVEQYY